MVLRRKPYTNQRFVSTRPEAISVESARPSVALRPSALIFLGFFTTLFVFLASQFPSLSTQSTPHSPLVNFASSRADVTLLIPRVTHQNLQRELFEKAHTVHQDFIASTDTAIPYIVHRPSESITANIHAINGDYSYATIDATLTYPSGETKKVSTGWTFRSSDGRVVLLNDLLSSSKNGANHLNELLRQSSPSLAHATLHPSSQSFTPSGNHTLTVYPDAAPHPNSAIDIPITPSLAPYFTGTIAKKIFDAPVATTITTAKNQCAHEKCVALTFDDGPGPYTNRLLNILKKHHTKATFFLLGQQVEKFPDSVKREVSEGHSIGNHTWNHPALTLVSEQVLRSQIKRTNKVIRHVTGIQPEYLRPPYGAADDSVRVITRNLHMSSIFWSVDTDDWKDLNSAIVCKRATRDARAGSIIIMHDIHETTVEAIPCIIKGLKKKGLLPVTVPELLGKTKPGGYYYEAE